MLQFIVYYEHQYSHNVIQGHLASRLISNNRTDFETMMHGQNRTVTQT